MQGEERGRQIRGRGRTRQTEAEKEQDEFYVGATEWAGEAIWRDALPGRVHEGGTEPETRAVGGPRAGMCDTV